MKLNSSTLILGESENLNKIQKIYPLTETDGTYKPYLFIDYYQRTIVKDNYLSDMYLQIERNMRRYLLLKDGLVFYKGNQVSENNPFQITLKDRLGNLRPSEVVKKMVSASNIYEVRINSEYEKNRVLFFPYIVYSFESLVFTYGFTKRGNEDMTQALLQHSQTIRDELGSNVREESIIGEEFSV